MTPQQFIPWLNNLSKIASEQRFRKVVVLEGTPQWANNLLELIPTYPNKHDGIKGSCWYIYSDSILLRGNVNKQTYKNTLGTESQYVLFYSQSFNVDAFAALSGTLIPGGILFVLLPSGDEQKTLIKGSQFNERFIHKLKNNKSVEYITEENKAHYLVDEGNKKSLAQNKVPEAVFNSGCKTAEQVQAVQHVIQVVKGHRNRPLVLTADRGRGKSSALAIACANLLNSTTIYLKIVITSAHRQSLDVYFKQLLLSTNKSRIISKSENVIEHEKGEVRFLAVDEIVNRAPEVNLLLVDEAASIPLYYLNELMTKYHRIVFSSTIHGYEGAGRSFSVKFVNALKAKYPECKKLHIHQPIRWADNDPVEAFIFDLCLLNAELPEVKLLSNPIKHNEVTFSLISSKALLENEVLLKQVFALLVTAHYQTSPSDLVLMLDNDNLSVFILSYKQSIVGVALTLVEGNITQGEIELIKKNKRRLKNQFIPQSLLKHNGEENSFSYSYLRIMRIAILPDLQQMGLGAYFLSQIQNFAKKQEIDIIGTSFGANRQLLNFWQKQGFIIARVGFTKDKASGEHSALLIKSINTNSLNFVSNIESQFYESFDYLLAEQYQQLSTTLVWQVMHYCSTAHLPKLTGEDLKTIADFYSGSRQYNNCVFALHKWLLHQMKKPFNEKVKPVISKIFQKNSINNVCKKYNFTGKNAFNQFLMLYVEQGNKDENE